MEIDLIYPERREDALDAECVIAAVFFDNDELLSFGVDSNSWELDDAFYDYNQFEKAFELWGSPLYVSDFYDRFRLYFQEPYWRNISEDTFLKEVDKSRGVIRHAIYDAFENNSFYDMVEPLDHSDSENRLSESVRVKLKQCSRSRREKMLSDNRSDNKGPQGYGKVYASTLEYIIILY